MRVTANMRRMIGERRLMRTGAAIKNDSENTKWDDPEYFPGDHDTATLVTSELPDGNHMMVLDIDLPCMLVPSTKEDHYHLYVNKPVSWGQYLNVLQALTDAGIVQEGYNMHTRRRGYGTVRYPGVTKQNEHERIAKAKKTLAEIEPETF